MTTSLRVLALLSTTLTFAACGGSDDSDTGGTAGTGGGAGDGGAGASGATGGDGGAGASGASGATGPSGVGDCPAATAALPATRVTVDGTTFYLVAQSPLGNPTGHSTQLNFGTEAQFRQCPGETGQNSTFAIQLSFKAKPLASATYLYSSSRRPTDDLGVNLYVTFFNNTGSARAGKNYLSPDGGSLVLELANDTLKATLDQVTIANEVDPGDAASLSGALELPW